MDRRSWLWRRKSLEKSPGETESSGSLSSLSERYSDDQEVLRCSTNQMQSPEVASNIGTCDDHQTVRELTLKLSAALANVRAKENLVAQHAKVAEEAVSGWEKAESEVATLKRELETISQKNSALESRTGQLDGALKECIRQLRQAREEQEKKIHDALVEKILEWEDERSALEYQVSELESQLEAAKPEDSAYANHELQLKLEKVEKENSDLKLQLVVQSEQLRVRTREMELSNLAAETASKQHLDSIKKLAKVESECRKLRATIRRPPSIAYVETLKDSRSDSCEEAVSLDNEPSCSGSWASALVAQLDQIKSEDRSIEMIGTMDDFLEMERLAALHEVDHGPVTGNSDRSSSKKSLPNAELETLLHKTSELEERIGILETEKGKLERILVETQERLDKSSENLKEREGELLGLRRQLGSSEIVDKAAETKRKELESKLEEADSMVQQLQEKMCLLEEKAEQERLLGQEYIVKCRKLEDELLRKKAVEIQQAGNAIGKLKLEEEKELAVAAGKFAECQKTITSLRLQLRALAMSEVFILEDEKRDPGGSSVGERETIHGGSSADDDPIQLPSATSSSLQEFRNLSVNLEPVHT